ncbi:MAG: hypothetical protein ACYCOX_05510 [Acidobacteriaceae bacterium]
MSNALTDTKSSTVVRKISTFFGESTMRKSVAPRFDAALQRLIDNAAGETKEKLIAAQKRIAEADKLTEKMIREGALPAIEGWQTWERKDDHPTLPE